VKGFLERRKVRRWHSDNPRREMTFLEHLGELRGRLIIGFVSIFFTTIVGGIFFAQPMLDVLTRPFNQAKPAPKPEDMLVIHIAPDGTLHAINAGELKEGQLSKQWVKIVGPRGSGETLVGPGTQQGLVALTLMAPFLLLIKAAIIIGIVFAMPIWLWQLWLFVAPALTTFERRTVRPVLLAGIFLFPIGVACAYLLFTLTMPYLLQYASFISGVQMMPDIQKYVSFALNLMLSFGLIFEAPLALVIVVRMGFVSTATLARSRPYAVVIIFIVAAILTPTTDPFTLIGMALPMLLLYEISLWVCRIVEQKTKAAEKRAVRAGEVKAE